MGWFVPRLLAGLVAALVGGSIGYWLGLALHAPLLGAIAGAGLAAVVLAGVDSLRGARLMAWLRGSKEGAVPHDAGFWGEVGYRVERSLRAAERATLHERDRLARFIQAIEASPNGVLMLDASERIEWCNSVAADHFAIDPQRDRLQHITNLVRAPAFVAYLQAGDFSQSVQFPDPRGTGLLAVQVRDYGEGRKLVLSQDVTERERAEGMRRDFVANVSHEIRTPLTVLAGFVETLQGLPLTDVERKRVLLLMGQQTQRMHNLIADLLTLAQLEGSPRPPTDRWLPVDRLLRQIEAEAQSLSLGRHTIRVAHDDATEIAGAENELHSAFANLLSNAVRYTAEGGHIDVRWRRLADGTAEFAVQDEGPGIESEHLPRLTERFYRIDGSRSRETGGTGLGLSIVKHVVQRHGGELDVQSERGKGSTFRIILPASRLRTIADGDVWSDDMAAGRDSTVGARANSVDGSLPMTNNDDVTRSSRPSRPG